MSELQDLPDEIPQITDEEEKDLKRQGDLEMLRRRIKGMEEENKNLIDELNKKENTIIQTQEETHSLKKTEEDEKRLTYLRERAILLGRIRILDEENKKLQDGLHKKQKVERLSPAELEKKIDEQLSLIERLLTQIKEEGDRYCKERNELDQTLKQKEDLIHYLKDKNENLKKENNELLNRLSKIASDRLTHENTDIPDLSDEIRPTKLAEKISELYDNQWTDAYDELKTNNHVDKETIRILLKIFMESQQVCKDLSFSRYEKLKETCYDIKFSSSADGENKRKDTTSIKDKLSMILQQDIKRIWRESCKILFREINPIIEKKVAEKFDFLSLKMIQTQAYLKECIELCWFMNLQEKPMHLDINVKGKAGHPYFDTEKFIPYTQTGQYIDFVVWPAVYLFEGGPLLKKGVAQGSIVSQCSSGQDDSCRH